MNALFVHELAKRVGVRKASEGKSAIEILGVCPGWCDTCLARHVEKQDGRVRSSTISTSEEPESTSTSGTRVPAQTESTLSASSSSHSNSGSASLNPVKRLGLYLARSMFQRSAREGAQNIVHTVVEEHIPSFGVFYRDGSVDKEMAAKLRDTVSEAAGSSAVQLPNAKGGNDVETEDTVSNTRSFRTTSCTTAHDVSEKLWELSNLMCDDWLRTN